MAVTLSYGFINPQNGDVGSIWFAALNSNIVQLNGHTHNGSNSSLLAPSSIAAGKVSVLAANWTGSAGNYSQVCTVPSGLDMTDDYSITVYDSSNNIIATSIDYVSPTTFKIYSPDNTFAYTVVFR